MPDEAPSAFPGLTPGRIVHYLAAGEHRAAIVVRVVDAASGTVDLTVFGQDGQTSGRRAVPGGYPSGPDGSWHFLERV